MARTHSTEPGLHPHIWALIGSSYFISYISCICHLLCVPTACLCLYYIQRGISLAASYMVHPFPSFPSSSWPAHGPRENNLCNIKLSCPCPVKTTPCFPEPQKINSGFSVSHEPYACWLLPSPPASPLATINLVIYAPPQTACHFHAQHCALISVSLSTVKSRHLLVFLSSLVKHELRYPRIS